MIPIDKETIERLKSGDFNNATIKKWFKNYAFSYIFAMIDGCDKKIDFDTLELISKSAESLLIKPDVKCWNKNSLKELVINSGCYPVKINEMSQNDLINFWESRVIKICESILQSVIQVCSRHTEYYGDIIERLSTNPNANVRLHCCANGNYIKFLNDSSQRVQKVANIRHNFEQNWNNLSDEEKERITFLTLSIENGLIECWDGDVAYKEDDKMYAMFLGGLVQGESWNPSFDSDIFYSIGDKRILANEINKLVKEGKLILKKGAVPDCFSQTKDVPVLKKVYQPKK